MQSVIVENGVVTATGSGSITAPDWVQCGDLYADGVFTQSEANRNAPLWAAFLEDGWTDPTTGIKLRTTVDSRDAFAGFITMLQEGIDLGAITNASPTSIWDYNDTERQMTVLEARQLLFRYGIAWKTAFDTYAP